MSQLETFVAMRGRIRALSESIDTERALKIPDGFNNNIAWNIGHIAVTQQLLCYKLSGVPLRVDGEWVERFGKGTGPRDWAAAPDMGAVHGALTDLAEQFVADYAAGQFTQFEPYTTSAGLELKSIDDAIAFNALHEGMHLGITLALLHVV